MLRGWLGWFRYVLSWSIIYPQLRRVVSTIWPRITYLGIHSSICKKRNFYPLVYLPWVGLKVNESTVSTLNRRNVSLLVPFTTKEKEKKRPRGQTTGERCTTKGKSETWKQRDLLDVNPLVERLVSVTPTKVWTFVLLPRKVVSRPDLDPQRE